MFYWLSGVKQAYACMFGDFLLALVVITKFWYPLEALHRYDFVFLAAIAFQLFFITFRLEVWREFTVIFTLQVTILVCHIVATVDAIGAWLYPEQYVFGIANLPLLLG
ncbi:DUF817 family protein [Pseudidiomarina sp. E22-M8]|uniref:DUF817 family protein n=1 Tax=Pseudidiomarina sp. E22-M8 TaxID=3424768 RepID=UPI00403C5CAE